VSAGASTPARVRVAGAACLLLLIVLLWAHPLLSASLAHQNDIPVHLRWAEQFLDAFREGWILPRWAYASRGGLGDPTFFYYQPLFYYFTTAFALLGVSAQRALLLAAMVPYVLLAGVVYLGVLRRYPNRHALLGTMFVVACPLLYFLSTHMAAFPWSLSLPFSVLFAAESSRDEPRPQRLAVLLSLICLSHLLSGLMTLLCTGLGRLIFAFPNRRTLPGNIAWAIGVALGLALSAFFVYPAVTQMALITPTGWTTGSFDWRKCFIFPTFSLLHHPLHWFAIQWPLALLALMLAAIGVAQRRYGVLNPRQVQAQRIAIIALAAVAFGTELAYPLYAGIGAMQKLQFPYRFVFLASILGSVALVIHLCEGAWARWGRIARALVVLLVLAQFGQLAIMERNLYRDGEPLLDRAHFMQGLFGQPEYMPAVSGPHWDRYVADGKLDGECRRLGLRCEQTSQHTHAQSFTIETPRAVAVRLPLFAFPAWRLSIDGQPQALLADADTGTVVAQLAPGRHQVALTWSGLPAEKTGRIITLVALAALALLLVRARVRTRARAGETHAGVVHGAAGEPVRTSDAPVMGTEARSDVA
jgi:hypothetical protein